MRRRISISRGRFRRYIRRAVAVLPDEFRLAADNLIVAVERAPVAADHADHQARGTDQAQPLLGIYRGIPLSARTAGYQLAAPDVIAVFRRPLLGVCRNRRQLEDEIQRTVKHELGHYFGLDEDAVEHL